jgi:hypothetical protein
MFNAGQCCCGIERIYVHEASTTPSSRRPSPGSKYKLGNPLDPRPRWARWPISASPRGARADRRGRGRRRHGPYRRAFAADDGGAYLTPQILTGVTHDMRVMRDESFGPVVGIMPVKDDDEAIADERQPLRPDRLALDRDAAARRGHRRPARDRHRLHEPLRLSRPGAVLDRLQGHRRGGGLSVSAITT